MWSARFAAGRQWCKLHRFSLRRSYEVLYNQLGISRVVEWVQLGLLDPSRTITIKVGPPS